MTSDYDCPDCGGTGKVECECCRRDDECESCHGSGFDDAKIDVPRYVVAEMDATRRWGGSVRLVRDGKALGRQSLGRAQAKGPEYAFDVLYYADYARAKEVR